LIEPNYKGEKMNKSPHKILAERLDALPNGYPPTETGSELRLLEKLFTPEEAILASQLRLTLETPFQIIERLGRDSKETFGMLKTMVRKGLIKMGRIDGRLGFGILPFAVGIYEFQVGRMDEELARLFEDYYQEAFHKVLSIRPLVHRVVPVMHTVQTDTEVLPFESASHLIENAKSWGVVDCLCRTQKALIGDPCDHPLDVCMVLSDTPGGIKNHYTVRNLTKEEAFDTLQKAADAGLVHSVGNNQVGHWYICNCCTCSCGILRGMEELGIANVIAHSSFVIQVDEDLCIGCGICVEHCQFDALEEDIIVNIDKKRCIGCGICVPTCPEGALALVKRPAEEIKTPPMTEDDWFDERAIARNIDIKIVR
jgi:ferredoxin